MNSADLWALVAVFCFAIAILATAIICVYAFGKSRILFDEDVLFKMQATVQRLDSDSTRYDTDVRAVIALMKAIDEDPSALAHLSGTPARIVAVILLERVRTRAKSLIIAEKELARAIKVDTSSMRRCSGSSREDRQAAIAELQATVEKRLVELQQAEADANTHLRPNAD